MLIVATATHAQTSDAGCTNLYEEYRARSVQISCDEKYQNFIGEWYLLAIRQVNVAENTSWEKFERVIASISIPEELSQFIWDELMEVNLRIEQFGRKYYSPYFHQASA